MQQAQGPQLPPGFENIRTVPKPERQRKIGDFIYPKIATKYGN